VTTRCKVEKWDADSGEVLDAQTCVRTLASIFSPLLSLVSDNCHSHRAKRHVPNHGFRILEGVDKRFGTAKVTCNNFDPN
jgi:hypothetical protein